MMKKALISAVVLVFVASLANAAAIAPDATRIACGARVLGMGKAFVGLADDVNSIFSNPSGISQIDRWQITSMSGNVMDFNYLTLSGVYPTNFGNVGLGFSGASIGGAYASKIKQGTEDTSDPLYEFDYSQTAMNYYNNVFILSYGGQVEQALQIPLLKGFEERLAFMKNLSFGTNLKIFSAGLAGDGITNGSATGTELDIGVLGKINPWLNVGFTATNVMPFAMGGKLVYASNHEESYPVNVKLGTAINLLGPKDALREFNQKLKFVMDLDTYPTRNRYPMIYHFGVEWTPISLISIRAGIDQDAAEDESGSIVNINNFTAGVGLTYQMFRFDYGFHQFTGVTGQDNHFFALTYGIPTEQVKKEMIEVYQPQDKTVTKETTALVLGKVDREARFVSVNNTWATLNSNYEFGKKIELNLGKNSITVEALDIAKSFLDKKKIRLCRLATFPDVPADYWAVDQIGYIATLGIIQGYPEGTFKPDNMITRAELATVLVRTRKIAPDDSQTVFKDVRKNHWAAKYIMPAVKYGIVKGYPDGTFKPSQVLTRAEGLAMIARFSGVTPESYAVPFRDVSATHWAAPIISGAYRAGMLMYLYKKPFEPSRQLTRAEAVEMLFRSPYVQSMIKEDLLNWETY